jgi:HPt (histidine-containing phosphotransfer) domain-containing protein
MAPTASQPPFLAKQPQQPQQPVQQQVRQQESPVVSSDKKLYELLDGINKRMSSIEKAVTETSRQEVDRDAKAVYGKLSAMLSMMETKKLEQDMEELAHQIVSLMQFKASAETEIASLRADLEALKKSGEAIVELEEEGDKE